MTKQRVLDFIGEEDYCWDSTKTNELVEAILSLSQAEIEALRNEARENKRIKRAFNELIYGGHLSYAQGIQVMTKLSPNSLDMSPLTEFRERFTNLSPIYLYNLDSVERKQVEEQKEKLLGIFSSLEKLADKKIIDAWSGVVFSNYFGEPSYHTEEALSEYLEAIIKQHKDDIGAIEDVVVLWEKILPGMAGRKLRRIVLETTDPQLKENVQRALIMLGESTMGTGDTYHITNTGIVNIKATLNNTTQTINNSSNIDHLTKKELEQLMERLHTELEKVPLESTKDAENVAKKAKMLVDATDEEKPDKELIEITADRLLKAAQNIAKVMPVVLLIVKQIIALLVGL